MMSLENKLRLSVEQNEYILKEVERMRRTDLVCEMYEKCADFKKEGSLNVKIRNAEVVRLVFSTLRVFMNFIDFETFKKLFNMNYYVKEGISDDELRATQIGCKYQLNSFSVMANRLGWGTIKPEVEELAKKGIKEDLGLKNFLFSKTEKFSMDFDYFMKSYESAVLSEDPQLRHFYSSRIIDLAVVDESKYVELCFRGMNNPDKFVRQGTALALISLPCVDPGAFVKLFYQGINDSDDVVQNAVIRGFDSMILSIPDPDIVPVVDETYSAMNSILGSDYVLNSDLSIKSDLEIISELKIFAKEFSGTAIKINQIIKSKQPQDLSNLIACSRFNANELFLRKLGQGVSGETYLVHSPTFQRDMAIKVVKHKSYNSEEAKILASLNHENIVRVWYAGNHFVKFDSVPVNAILMDYVDGESLSDLIKMNPEGLRFDQAISYSKQLFAGIDYLRSKNIFHRDLNLNNIKINSERILKILDFGIAVDSLEESPKDNRKYGGESDFFSWALITYKLLSGSHLIPNTTRSNFDESSDYADHISKLKAEIWDNSGILKTEYASKILSLKDPVDIWSPIIELSKNFKQILVSALFKTNDLDSLSSKIKTFFENYYSEVKERSGAYSKTKSGFII